MTSKFDKFIVVLFYVVLLLVVALLITSFSFPQTVGKYLTKL